MADSLYPYYIGGELNGQEIPEEWRSSSALLVFQHDRKTGKCTYRCEVKAYGGKDITDSDDWFYYAAIGSNRKEAEAVVDLYRRKTKTTAD